MDNKLLREIVDFYKNESVDTSIINTITQQVGDTAYNKIISIIEQYYNDSNTTIKSKISLDNFKNEVCKFIITGIKEYIINYKHNNSAKNINTIIEDLPNKIEVFANNAIQKAVNQINIQYQKNKNIS